MSTYKEGDWVIRRFDRETPVRIVKIIEWHGVDCGYLIEHDGAGMERVSGENVRLCPRELIPKWEEIEKRRVKEYKPRGRAQGGSKNAKKGGR